MPETMVENFYGMYIIPASPARPLLRAEGKQRLTMAILQTQHGYPLVEGDGGKKGTTRVHTFGAHWANQMGDGYKLQYFSAAK